MGEPSYRLLRNAIRVSAFRREGRAAGVADREYLPSPHPLSQRERGIFVKRGADARECAIGLVPDDVVAQPEDPQPALVEKCVSRTITLSRARCVVDCTIDLDDECGIAAEEVDDVRTDRMLAPELRAERASAKQRPECAFRWCRL